MRALENTMGRWLGANIYHLAWRCDRERVTREYGLARDDAVPDALPETRGDFKELHFDHLRFGS